MIVSDLLPLADAIQENRAGTVVGVGDLGSLRRALLAYVEDQQQARSFGANARRLIETHFDVEKAGRTLAELIVRLRLESRVREGPT